MTEESINQRKDVKETGFPTKPSDMRREGITVGCDSQSRGVQGVKGPLGGQGTRTVSVSSITPYKCPLYYNTTEFLSLRGPSRLTVVPTC